MHHQRLTALSQAYQALAMIGPASILSLYTVTALSTHLLVGDGGRDSDGHSLMLTCSLAMITPFHPLRFYVLLPSDICVYLLLHNYTRCSRAATSTVRHASRVVCT
jgi:hypothetical protein